MLTIHDRKKKKEGVSVEGALCKALGWFFPLMAKFRVLSVEELLFKKYPFVCPYCRLCPHREAICKTIHGASRTVDHAAVEAKRLQNRTKRPHGLAEWQLMFDEIYPRDTNSLGVGRSSISLFEELGELAEAVRVFDRYPKYFAGEAADVFSYLTGIANEHRISLQMDSSTKFDLEAVFLKSYPGMCVQCGNQVCACPSIPESTVGRLAKELDISETDNLFGLDTSSMEQRGKEVGLSILQELGGLPAIAHKLPLDRGDANHALVLLCLRLSQEVLTKNELLAGQLRDSAIKIAGDARTAGSRSQGEASNEVLELLTQVWPLLNLAVIPEDKAYRHV